ncbi:MAG: hypothetical protein ACLT16_09725, partial [[Clostridium] innocuum]
FIACEEYIPAIRSIFENLTQHTAYVILISADTIHLKAVKRALIFFSKIPANIYCFSLGYTNLVHYSTFKKTAF